MRVVVADDSLLLREGVVRLLQDAGLEVVGQAGDAPELLRKVRTHKPDVAVVDIRMPPNQTEEGAGGREADSQRAARRRRAGAQRLRRGAVRGRAALRQRGGCRLPPQGPGRRPEQVHRGRANGRRGRLGARSRGGLADGAIADELVVTERAVEKHVTGIFSKLGLTATPTDHRRVLAVLAYLKT